ncbi:MAG: hypothetical protein ACAH89_01920 [Rariglobus sp.]
MTFGKTLASLVLVLWLSISATADSSSLVIEKSLQQFPSGSLDLIPASTFPQSEKLRIDTDTFSGTVTTITLEPKSLQTPLEASSLSVYFDPAADTIKSEAFIGKVYNSQSAYKAITGLEPTPENLLQSLSKPFTKDTRIEVSYAAYLAITHGIIASASEVDRLVSEWGREPSILYHCALGILGGPRTVFKIDYTPNATGYLETLVRSPDSRVYGLLAALELADRRDARAFLIFEDISRWNSTKNFRTKAQLIRKIQAADGQYWNGSIVDSQKILKEFSLQSP